MDICRGYGGFLIFCICRNAFSNLLFSPTFFYHLIICVAAAEKAAVEKAAAEKAATEKAAAEKAAVEKAAAEKAATEKAATEKAAAEKAAATEKAAAEKAATEKAAAEKAATEKPAADKAATEKAAAEKAATEKAAAEKAAVEKAAAEKAATEKAAAEKAAATEKDVLEGEVVSRALAQGSKEWQRSKVMMVGQGRAGKTALSNAMVGRPFRDTESTVGINQLTCDIKHAALSAQGGGAEHDGDGKTVGSAWAECSRPERELEAAVAAIALSLSGAAAGTGCDTAARPHDQSLLSSLRQQKAASIEAARGLTLHGGGFAELEEGDRGGFAEVISSGSASSSAADRGRSIHTLDVPSSKISAAAQTQQASHTAPLQPSLDVRSGASTAVAVAAPSPSSFPADVGEVDEALVMSLLGDVRSSTPGLLISLFDYGGQSVFDVIHHLFLTSNGVYALVFNMEWFVCAGTSTSTSTNDSKSTSDAHFPAEMERALRFMRSWLSSIAVHTFDAASGSTAPIVLVGTRLDVVKDPATHSRISTLLNQQFSDHVAWPSVLENTQARNADGRATHCFFPIDNTAAAGSDSMRQLMAVVERTIDSAAYTHKHVPLTWLRTMDKMHCSSSSGGGGKGEGERQKQSCTSLKEVSACAVQCGMAEDEVPYFLSFLHDMGHLMWHDEPDLRDIVIFDAVRFLVEPATIIICKLNPDFNDETHHLVGSHKECQKKHKQKWGQLVRLGVLHTVLLDVMWRDFSAHREVLLALMVKFGLLVPLRRSFEAEAEAEGSNTVTNLEGTSQYLVPSVLSPVPSNDASLLDWTDDAYCSCFFVFTVTADLEHSPALTKADLATHGFLPTGLFERCVGEALSWAQSTSNQESFNIEDVAVLHKDLAIMMFGRQRFRLLLCNDINCIKVDIEGSSNPRTVQFRLLSLIKKIIDTCMKNLRCFTALVFETGDDDTESQRAKFQPSGQCSSIADGGMTDADMLIPLQQLRATVEGNSMLCWRGGRTLLTPEQVKGRYRVWLQLKELLDHYDVFISYRQCSYDSRLTLVLFDMFTNYVLGKDKRGVEVFLDTRRLQEGRPFDEDFSAALMCSTLAMPIVSHDALQRMVEHDSDYVDNVLLE